jgi:spore coat protein CotH
MIMMHFFQFIFFFSCIVLTVSSCSDSKPTRDKDRGHYKSIPTINIQTTGTIPWDKKDSCTAFYINKGDTIEIGARIKCRGGMSSRYDKHSYSIEFDKYLKIGDSPADDDWILNASYIDKTFQRHKLSYDLYRQMDSNNVAAECQYIRVMLNGNYQGLYIAMQEINGSMIGLDKKDPNAMLFKDPPIFYKERLENPQDSNNYYQQKFPKIKVSSRTKFLDEFNAFLFQTTDEEFDKFIGEWVDIESVIDWHLILLLSNNDDGLFKNFYVYKLNVETPMRFAIWDYDHSYGRNGDGTINRMDPNSEVGCYKIILLKRLLESKTLGYGKKLSQKWYALEAAGVFTLDNVKRMIDENTRLLDNHQMENFEKWPIESKWYEDKKDYNAEIRLMKWYFEERFKFLKQYMNALNQ